MREMARRAYRAASERGAFGSFLWRVRHGHPLNSSRRRIRGRDNVIIARDSLLHRVTFDITGDGNRIEIGRRCRLRGVRFTIRGNGHRILIGDGCVFEEGGDLVLEDDECTLSIGARTTFIEAALAVTESGSVMSIGEDCMFAYRIEARTGDSHAILDVQSGDRLNPAQDVSIADRVWIGVGVMLLKGTAVLADSVVGAGSIVSSAFVESNVVIAGNPARIVRRGIAWTRERTGSPQPHA